MPLLPAEPSVYPENLLDGFTMELSHRRWWALHTKPRQEKSLARQLFGQELCYYLPQMSKTLIHRGRKRKSFVPLFAGYLFLFGDEAERARSLGTNRVTQVLPVADGEELRRDLQQIYQLIAANAALSIESRLAPGQQVRVKSGAFMGMEGTVLQRRGECRLLVAVNFLQRGVSVQIDDFLLEPI
jgi:transcriptional antiterminator RfaH